MGAGVVDLTNDFAMNWGWSTPRPAAAATVDDASVDVDRFDRGPERQEGRTVRRCSLRVVSYSCPYSSSLR